MAGTFHLHLPRVQRHLDSVQRDTLAFGWPHRVAAVLMVALGVGFIGVTFAANLFHVGPAFDRLTDGFRPIMTQSAIQTDRADIAGLANAGTEIQTKMIPGLAQQLGMTPAQFATMMNAQFPAVAAGLNALPTVTPQFSGLVNTLDAQRPYFAAADAIPTKSVPSTSVPWALAAVGLVSAVIGALVWFKPHVSAMAATGVGALLIAAPLVLSMPHKADYADTLNANLKPVYTQSLITDAKASLTTLSAMGTEMQTKMLPALATQLKMTPTQLQQMLDQNFPATAATLKGMDASMTRFQNLVATFDKHLADYNVLKPVTFVPIVQAMIGGGIALFLMGAAGMFFTRSAVRTNT